MIEVNESINVMVAFSDGKVKPRAFLWNKKVHKIEKINFAYSNRKGIMPVLYFTLTAEGKYYKISFSVADMIWNLIETEG